MKLKHLQLEFVCNSIGTTGIILMIVGLLFTSNLIARNINKDQDAYYYVASNLEEATFLENHCQNFSSNSFQLFSHGKSGALLIDNKWKKPPQIAQWLTSNKFLQNQTQLNIYGCNFAKGEKGKAAVAYLENVLNICVAASNDITGINGDWELEVGNNNNSISAPNYKHNLQTATLPMQPGMAAVTCFSGIADESGAAYQSTPSGFVMSVYDIREPDCDANGATDDSVTPNWPDNWQASSDGAYHHSSWTAQNLGEVFGIEIVDNVTAPDIYVSSDGFTKTEDANITMATGGTGGDVFKINGTTGAITKLASLPNTAYTYSGFSRYVGLGNLSVNLDDGVIYVTNIDNGLLYVIDESTGGVLDTYDHLSGTADDTNLHFTQLERMVYGVKYNKCDGRLYYSAPTAVTTISPSMDYTTENSIFSVALNANGTIDDTSVQTEIVLAAEVTTAVANVKTSFPIISDIEFSDNCSQMMVSERTIATNDDIGSLGIFTIEAHRASVYRYTGSAMNWTQTTEYNVGLYSFDNTGQNDSNNSAGGADFGYGNYGACGEAAACEDAAVIIADAAKFEFGSYIYGIQISDINGNATGFPNNTYVVDLDGIWESQSEIQDKSLLGDVDVYGLACATCTTPSAPVISITDNDCDAGTAGFFAITTDCDTGSHIEWLADTSPTPTWTTTTPTYDNAITINVVARCVDDADATCFSEDSNVLTSSPTVCSSCTTPTAPVISVTDNDCDAGTAGSFAITTDCGAGSHIEWSADNGATWSTTIPTYSNSTFMNVVARCVDDTDATCVSANSNALTSSPTDCASCKPKCLNVNIDIN